MQSDRALHVPLYMVKAIMQVGYCQACCLLEWRS